MSDFESADVCHYLKDFNNKIKQSITSKTEIERNSILNDYLKINPLLISPSFYTQYTIKEYDRLIITKYRTGSHFLKIPTGRYTQLEQSQRLCECEYMQTLNHIIFKCAKVNGVRDNGIGSNLLEFFNDNDTAAPFLRVIEKMLNLR